MNSRIINVEQFLNLLLAEFSFWRGKDEYASIFKNTLDANKSLPFFNEALIIFKKFINDPATFNPWKYECKPLLNNYLFKMFSDQVYKVTNADAFKNINAIIDDAIKASETNVPINVTDAIVTFLQYLNENKWMLIAISLLANTTHAAGVQSKATDQTDNILTDSFHSAKTIYETPSLHSAFVSLQTCSGISQLDTQLVFDRIVVDKKYADKLTASEVLAKRREMLALLLHFAEDPMFAKELNNIFSSEAFQFIILEQFEENPYGVGLYSGYRNKLFVKDRAKYFCSDFEPTVRHELHHASITNARTNGMPITACKSANLKLAEEKCDVYGEPFTNRDERLQLEKAIRDGNDRVTKRLNSLHKKFNNGSLTDVDELNEYKKYKAVLSDYQPRCIAHFVSNYDPAYSATLKNLEKNLAINMSKEQKLYPLHHEVLDDGVVVFGNFVNDVQTIENRITAFISDTQYIRTTWIQRYNPRGENPALAALEQDAETHGDSDAVLNTFYPELRTYHRNFRG